MTNNDKLIANPLIVLREEFDDWAVLFDPDTGNAFGMNPISVFIWKHLDGQHTVKDITEKLHKECEDAPDDAEQYVKAFIEDLADKGMAGHDKAVSSKL